MLKVLVTITIGLLLYAAVDLTSKLEEMRLELASAQADKVIAENDRDHLLSGGRWLCRRYDPRHGCTYVFAPGQSRQRAAADTTPASFRAVKQ